MTGCPNFVPEKENRVRDIFEGCCKRGLPLGKGSEGLGYGFDRLWEGYISLEMCSDGLL